MARFFKTARPELVEDFLFQPDWDLAAAALQKQDEKVEGVLQERDFLGNPMFEYWDDADQEGVKTLKAQYNDRADQITGQLQSLKDINKVRKDLNQFKKDTMYDFEFGDVSKYVKNNENYKAWKTKLDAMPDSKDKVRYQAAIDNYLKGSEGAGALKEIFDGPELFNSRYAWNEFMASPLKQNMAASSSSYDNTTPTGLYLKQVAGSSSEISKERIEAGFKQYVEENFSKEYAMDQEKYGGTKLLDAEGNFDFSEGSYLGNMMRNGTKAIYSKQTTNKTGYQSDGSAMWSIDRQDRLNREAAERESRLASLKSQLAVGKDVTDFYEHADFAADAQYDVLTELKENVFFGGAGKNISEENRGDQRTWTDAQKKAYKNLMENKDMQTLEGYIKVLKHSGKFPALVQAAENAQDTFYKSFAGGYSSPGTTLWTEADTKAYIQLKADINKRVEDGTSTFPVYLAPFENDKGVMINTNSKKATADQYVGKEIYNPKTGEYVTAAEFNLVANFYPQMVNHATYGKNPGIGEAQVTYYPDPKNTTVTDTFRVPVFYKAEDLKIVKVNK